MASRTLAAAAWAWVALVVVAAHCAGARAAAAGAVRAAGDEDNANWTAGGLEDHGRRLLATYISQPKKVKCTPEIVGCSACWKFGTESATLCATCKTGYSYDFENFICGCAVNYGTFCKDGSSKKLVRKTVGLRKRAAVKRPPVLPRVKISAAARQAAADASGCVCKKCSSKQTSPGGPINDATCEDTAEGVSQAVGARFRLNRPCTDDAPADIITALDSALTGVEGVVDGSQIISFSRCSNADASFASYFFRLTFKSDKPAAGEAPAYTFKGFSDALASVCDSLGDTLFDGDGCTAAALSNAPRATTNPPIPDEWVVGLPLSNLAASDGACPAGAELAAAAKVVGAGLEAALKAMPGVLTASATFVLCTPLGRSPSNGLLVEFMFNIQETHAWMSAPYSKALAGTYEDGGGNPGALCEAGAIPLLCKVEPRVVPDYAYAFEDPLTCQPGGPRRVQPTSPRDADTNATYVYALPDARAAVAAAAYFDPRALSPWVLAARSGGAGAAFDATYVSDAAFAGTVVSAKGTVVKQVTGRARPAGGPTVRSTYRMRTSAKLTRAVRLRAAGQVSGALLLTAKGGNGVFKNDRVSTIGVPVTGPIGPNFADTCPGFADKANAAADASTAFIIGTLGQLSSISVTAAVPDDANEPDGTSVYSYLEVVLYVTNKGKGQPVTSNDVIGLVWQPGPHQDDEYATDANLAEQYWFQRRRDLTPGVDVDMMFVPSYTSNDTTNSNRYPTIQQYVNGLAYRNAVQNAKGDASYTVRSARLGNSTRILGVGVGISPKRPADPAAADDADSANPSAFPKPGVNSQERSFWVSAVTLSILVSPDDSVTKDYTVEFASVIGAAT